MFNIGDKIKQFLLSDSTITNWVANKIFNVVAVADNITKPPYLVVEVNSISPNTTKTAYQYYDLSFSVILLTAKYSDSTGYSEAIKTALEFKNIDADNQIIDRIEFDDYKEGFDSNFELYTSRLSFSAIVFNT